MDAVKFLAEFKRMCKSYQRCAFCPLNDTEYCAMLPFNDIGEDIVRIVEQWSKDQDAKNHCSCSQCLYGRNTESQIGWNYCPYCGAKMDLEEN